MIKLNLHMKSDNTVILDDIIELMDEDCETLKDMYEEIKYILCNDEIRNSVICEETDEYKAYKIEAKGVSIDVKLDKPLYDAEYTDAQLTKLKLLNELSFAARDAKKNMMKIKKARRTTLTVTAVVTAGIIGVLSLVDWAEAKKAIAINKLEDEIAIHTNHFEIEGYKEDLNSHLKGTTCVIPKIEDLSIYDRIEIYCQDHDLGESVTAAAWEKFDYGYNDAMDLYKTINLKDVYKESKKNMPKK